MKVFRLQCGLSDPERLHKNLDHQQRVINTRDLFKFFYERDELNKSATPTWFYISAITISELRKIQSDELVEELINILSCGNVTFVDYTKETAQFLQKNYTNFLPSNQLKELLVALEKDLVLGAATARKWIQDDLKIAATQRSLKG